MSTQSEILVQYIRNAIKKEIVVHFCWYSSTHPNSLVHWQFKRISWNKRDSSGFLRFSRNSVGPYLENYLGLWPNPPFISQIFECLCVLQVNVAKWTGWAVCLLISCHTFWKAILWSSATHWAYFLLQLNCRMKRCSIRGLAESRVKSGKKPGTIFCSWKRPMLQLAVQLVWVHIKCILSISILEHRRGHKSGQRAGAPLLVSPKLCLHFQ